MRYSSRCRAVLFCVFALVGLFSSAFCMDLAPISVTEAAQSGLQTYLARIPFGTMAEYGFYTAEEIKHASLGTPFLLHHISPEAIGTYREAQSLSALLTASELWYFPIMVQGRYAAMLVVEQSSAQSARAVSFGYAPLATQLGTFFAEHPRKVKGGIVLVAVYQAREFLLAGEDQLIALQASPQTAKDWRSELMRLHSIVQESQKGGE